MFLRHYSLEEPAISLPMGFIEAQPVFGKRIITLHSEADSEEELSMLIAGNTWGFRTRLDAHGVPGAYFEGSNDTRTYYRVLKNVNVNGSEEK